MNKTEKTKKILALLSLAVVIILALLATLFVWKWLSSFSEEGFRDYIRSFGPWGWLVLFGVQFLQVFIALIPGEVVETAAGYAFGPLWGTVICYAGVAAASALIFFLTRRFGIRLVEVFVSREKINELKFINTSKKRNFLIFILFFIPGTPKDLITYFAGLTDIKITEFLCISLVARFPSVISSTFGGHLLGEGQYIHALLLYGITGAVSIAGLLIYNKIVKSRREKKK
ncbi:MAG: TVP38/TMEM64 family protein [Clostridia bacterium]|nr:TVP38/TMEM64 family protein [Clostridia bacterium]